MQSRESKLQLYPSTAVRYSLCMCDQCNWVYHVRSIYELGRALFNILISAVDTCLRLVLWVKIHVLKLGLAMLCSRQRNHLFIYDTVCRYNMETDFAENFNLADSEPVILAAIMRNFSVWHLSVGNHLTLLSCRDSFIASHVLSRHLCQTTSRHLHCR